MSRKLKKGLDPLFPFGRSNTTGLGLIYFFSNLYFYIPVSTLYLQGRGLNYLQINSLWGIIVGTLFIAEVPTGMMADRLGRVRSINIALALQLLGEIIFIFARNYELFALAAIAGGLGFAFSSGSVEALVYDSLKARGGEAEMSKAIGFINAAKQAANLLAFAAGGLLVLNLSQARFVLAIAVTAAAVALGWLISFRLREPGRATEWPAGDSSLRLLAEGLKTWQGDGRFRRLVLLSLATIPFYDYLLNLYQPRFVEVGVPPIWLGLALALASGLGIFGARYAYLLEVYLGPKLSLLGVTLLPGLLYLILALVAHPAPLVLVFCLLASSMSLKEPLFSGHLNRHIASQNRATVLSMLNMGSGIYVALLGLLIGRLADISLTYAFVLMGFIVLAGSLTFRVAGDNP